MPFDDVPNGISQFQATLHPSIGGSPVAPGYGTHDDGQNQTALGRLQQEAAEMTRQPFYGVKGSRDVTADFVSASGQLKPGQLVKDEYFTLFEAVGALEIMDPKMDSGCIPTDDTFEPDFDVCKGRSAAETLWIMDELLRLEISFHDGYPLSQNIFTSLHVMRLIHPDNLPPYLFSFDAVLSTDDMSVEDSLVQIVLRAYCVAAVKNTHMALDLIQSYTYYEEEDFVTYLFGRDLLPKLDVQDAVQALHLAAEHLEKSPISAGLKTALLQRLTLRECLLLCLDGGNWEQWQQLLEVLRKIKHSHGLGSPVKEAFSDKVQRQLATSTPPRPMPQLTWGDACAKWMQLCEDVLATFTLSGPLIRRSPHALQRATLSFAYRQPAPTTLARAKMQDMLTKYDSVGGDVTHFELMLGDIRDLVLAGDSLSDPASFQIEVPSDPRHRASRVIESFMEKAFGEYLNIYRMFCQNRCRMRRTFAQAVPLFDDIETEAIEADLLLSNIVVPQTTVDAFGNLLLFNPLTLWTRCHKLQIMQWVIQLGFETDLYLPREMAEMYFTLQKITIEREQVLRQIYAFTSKRSLRLHSTGLGEAEQQRQESEVFLSSLISTTEVTSAISEALGNLYSLLETQSLIDTSKRRYEERQLRFEARMKPFIGLAHDAVADRSALESLKLKSDASLAASCTSIDVLIKEARSSLADLKLVSAIAGKYMGTEVTWKQDIKALETVCVAVSVATSQLRRLYEKHGQSQLAGEANLKHLVDVILPAPGSRYHDWWIVPQIKPK